MMNFNERFTEAEEPSTVVANFKAVVLLCVLLALMFGCGRPLNCPTTNKNYFRQAQNLKPNKVSKNWYKCPKPLNK